jgi:hypothetical protein
LHDSRPDLDERADIWPASRKSPDEGSPGPAHVPDEVQFVEAFAEPGAEEGAGAEVHVEEPWRGYQQMSAHEVMSRLAEATREDSPP